MKYNQANQWWFPYPEYRFPYFRNDGFLAQEYSKTIALDKRRFNKNKDDYLKKLKSKRGAASKNQVLSYALCNDVLSIINDLRGYKNIIVETDMSVIDEQWNRLKRISLILQDGKKDNSSLQEFDVIVSTVMNVLSKGEYDL